MEKIFISLEEMINAVKTQFASEIAGFEFETPKLSLVFDTGIKDYIPAATIIGRKGNSDITLVNIPLKGEMLRFDSEERYMEVTSYGPTYRARNLTAQTVMHENKPTLALDFEPRKQICADAETAQKLIDDFMIICPEICFKEAYAALKNKSIELCAFCGILKFAINVSTDNERFWGILVNVADSSVMITNAPIEDVSPVEPGRYPNPNPAKETGFDMYFFNGKKFRLINDENSFMTKAEAKEVYENTPDVFKQQFTDYIPMDYVPVMCGDEFCYLISQSPDEKSVLIFDALIGFIVDFNVNIEQTVKYSKLGDAVYYGEGKVFVDEEGWKSSANQ